MNNSSKPTYGDELLQNFIEKLKESDDEILQKFTRILTKQSNSELLAQKHTNDGRRISLIMNSSCVRHMLKRGHLTGKSTSGIDDSLPLTIDDLKNIEKVFSNPDIEKIKDINNKLRIVMKKKVDGKPLSLVLKPNKDFSRLTTVTYYNCTPTHIKERLLLLRERK